MRARPMEQEHQRRRLLQVAAEMETEAGSVDAL
jgi:hypothetical protein